MSEAGTQAAGGHAQPSGSPPVDQFVELADWRERVAELYLAEPREGEAGFQAWRRARERLFLTHPSSALTARQRRRPGSARPSRMASWRSTPAARTAPCATAASAGWPPRSAT